MLKVSEEERDLGVIMHWSAKLSRQCAEGQKFFSARVVDL